MYYSLLLELQDLFQNKQNIHTYPPRLTFLKFDSNISLRFQSKIRLKPLFVSSIRLNNLVNDEIVCARVSCSFLIIGKPYSIQQNLVTCNQMHEVNWKHLFPETFCYSNCISCHEGNVHKSVIAKNLYEMFSHFFGLKITNWNEFGNLSSDSIAVARL